MCWPTFSNPRSTTATRAAIADCVGGARPLMHLVASVRADSAEGCGKSFLAAGPPGSYDELHYDSHPQWPLPQN